MLLHLVIAALFGGIFGLLMHRLESSPGSSFFWGLAYGSLLWFLGRLTLMPIFTTGSPGWHIDYARLAFPDVPAHLLYGAFAGLSLIPLRAESKLECFHCSPQAMGCGAVAGIFTLLVPTGWAFFGDAWQWPGVGLAPGWPQQGGMLSLAVAVGAGALVGILYSFIDAEITGGAGPILIRGSLYGFFWWIAGELTLLPLWRQGFPAWSLPEARLAFSFLPGYLLLGGLLALTYYWLRRVLRFLFSELPPGSIHGEGVGIQGVHVILRGILAGLVGGLLFTLVMIKMGILPMVARLAGYQDFWTGLAVHLVVASLIGISYAALFRGQSVDPGTAMGWGVSYGVLWWFLGPLTLMPILLGGSPQWSVAAASGLLDSLIGHILYGAALGGVVYGLEARYAPWWLLHRDNEAERVRQRRQNLLNSAPALWLMMVVLALTLPVLLVER